MKAYQLKITIKNSKPPIWRRCIVPAGLSFSQLTVILHKVMGWWEGHLSEYTFSSQGVKFLEESDGYGGGYWGMDVLDSSEYLIDEFFDNAKSFTYLYDFGDDWNHQVQIEKIIDDYEYNYPMVIKFKGDTPPEDCGGIWGYYQLMDTLDNPKDPEYDSMSEWYAEQANGPYDMELVNKELSKFKRTTKKIKPVKESDLLFKLMKSNGYIDLDQVEVPMNKAGVVSEKEKKEITKKLKEIGDRLNKLVSEKKKADKELRDAYGDSNVENYYEYLDQTNNGEKHIKTFFDYENWKEVTVDTSSHQMHDLMLNLRDIDIKNYIKYLQIPDKAGTKKLERIRKILGMLKENPEYYLYLYGEKELSVLFDLYNNDIKKLGFGEFVSDEVSDAIAISLLMGLIEVKEKGSKVRIRFAEDAGEVIAAIDGAYKKTGKKIYKELVKFDEQIGALIRNYGIIGIDRIAPMVEDIWGNKVDSTEIIRMVYLHYTMSDRLATATNYLAGESYVVQPGINAQKIMEYREKNLPSDFDYKPLNKKDAKISSYSITDIYYCWEDMATLFESDLELEPHEIGLYMDELFNKTLDGCDAVELFDELCEIYPTKNPFILSQYWYMCIDCVLDTGLPHLMGYSRYEYYQLTGQRPQNLTVTNLGTTGKKSKGTRVHLMYLPESIQWELYEIHLTDELKKHKDEYAERAQAILDKFPDNLELMSGFVDFFMAVGQQEKSELLLRRIKQLAPELSTEVNRMQNMIKKGRVPDYFESDLPFHDDSSLSYDEFNFWGENDYIPQKPVVRNTPKVGRNDPCPCGSGKKFKKCCMGKGIYD